MSSPRWRKAARDLWQNRTRTFLVVLAIAIGVFGIGLVADVYSILTRELDANYLRTNPASATLWTDPIDGDFAQTVQDLPAIGEAEARRKVVGRVQVGADEWKDIWLFVIDDFADVRVDTFEPEEGAWPSADGEILLERAALTVADAEIGEVVVVKIPDGPEQALDLVGTVHAPGLAPAWMEGWAYGFITPGTLEQLGGKPYLNELKVVVAENGLDEAHIKSTAYQLKDWMEGNGRQVYRVEIPEPGKHPHAAQMATLLFLLQAFGLLALVLSGVLVANMISALMAQQVRQIGMMKAIGARPRQIAGIYLGVVLILGLVALVPAMLVAILAGRAYAIFAADMLNFDILDDKISSGTYALQVAIGLLVPIVVAAYPIYRGSRITVQQALGDYGVGQGQFGQSRVDVWLGCVRGLARPLLLSIRNTFRRRARLALTLGTLAAGGAVFIVAMNVGASMDYSVASRFDALRYEVQVRFTRPYPRDQIERVIEDTKGVAQVESWGGARVARAYADGTEGRGFNLVAPPLATELISPLPLNEGRWLEPGDENALVINQVLLEQESDIRVGDEVVLRIDGQKTTWQVVGIVQEMMAPPTAYTAQASFERLTGQVGVAQNAVIQTESQDAATTSAVVQSLERNLEEAGLEVATTLKMADLRGSLEDHLKVLAAFLVLMAVLVVAVGGLGLMSTMSINVLERTCEIGVMRAIGASNRAVARIIVGEGALIGALSWLIAVALSSPVSVFVSNTFGMIFFEAPLAFAVSPLGFAIWLGIVVVFAAAASYYPAWNALRLTVNEVLAYE